MKNSTNGTHNARYTAVFDQDDLNNHLQKKKPGNY